MSIIKDVLSGDWTNLKDEVEQLAATKTMDRINIAKVEVLADINGVSVEDMSAKLNPQTEAPAEEVAEVTPAEEPKAEETPAEGE